MMQLIEELAERRQKWVDANRENGFEAGFKHLLTDLYPDNAHFIYELLQNAEDARAKEVRFILHKNQIKFEHDGEPFSIQDVEAITGIGFSTKRNDDTRIGKFGVGFKAVFAYTNSPGIESGNFHFRIRDMVVPETTRKPESHPATGKTRFVLPFDNPEKSPERAYDEIVKLLRGLDETTVLFLTHIQKIEYCLPDSALSGYIERITRDNSRFEVRVQQPDKSIPSSTWFLKINEEVQVRDEEMENEDHSLKNCRIAVAFGLSPTKPKTGIKKKDADDEEATPKWELAPIEPGRMCIYFPADKETSNLRFHLHAPFASTVARDSVRDSTGNNKLRDHLARLLAQSMLTIRDQGLLTVQALKLLPNEKDNLSEFYQPLMDQLVKEFKEQKLVPMKLGGHAAATGILKGRKVLSDLIEDDEMVMLLDDGHTAPVWAANPPQQNQREDNFLSMLGIEQWDTASLVKALGKMNQDTREKWMNGKDDKWHQNLYKVLGDPIAHLRYGDSHSEEVVQLNLIRCSDGIYRKGNECFFPTDKIAHDERFPLVKKEVYAFGGEENGEARKFLEKVGVRELDRVELVIERILPKYQDTNPVVPEEEHTTDIKKIEEAFKSDSQTKRTRLKDALRETSFILSRSPDSVNEIYRKPGGLYFQNDDLEMYFSGNSEVGFVSTAYQESTRRLFKELCVHHEVHVRREPDNKGFVTIKDCRSSHERGLDGYDPNIKVAGLDMALSSPSVEKSVFIWNKIALPNAQYIRGTIEKSTRSTYAGSKKKKHISEHFGSLLIEKEWLPGPNGQFHRPHELSLHELPDKFKRDEQLAGFLGMKKNEDAKLAEETGISLEIIQYVKNHLEDIEKFIAQESARKKHPTFPISQVANPEQRSERIDEQLSNSPDKEYEKRERSIRITRWTIDPNTRLREYYMNDDDQMICQICQEEMPFRKRDGTHYFEAVEALKFNKEHEAQYLALCPVCAAKYKEFIKPDDKAMTGLKDAINCTEDCEVPISLGDQHASIRFVETHLHDIRRILTAE